MKRLSKNWRTANAKRINCLWISYMGGRSANPTMNRSETTSIQSMGDRFRSSILQDPRERASLRKNLARRAALCFRADTGGYQCAISARRAAKLTGRTKSARPPQGQAKRRLVLFVLRGQAIVRLAGRRASLDAARGESFRAYQSHVARRKSSRARRLPQESLARVPRRATLRGAAQSCSLAYRQRESDLLVPPPSSRLRREGHSWWRDGR